MRVLRNRRIHIFLRIIKDASGYVNKGGKEKKKVNKTGKGELEKYISNMQFPEGSRGPMTYILPSRI